MLRAERAAVTADRDRQQGASGGEMVLLVLVDLLQSHRRGVRRGSVSERSARRRPGPRAAALKFV